MVAQDRIVDSLAQRGADGAVGEGSASPAEDGADADADADADAKLNRLGPLFFE